MASASALRPRSRRNSPPLVDQCLLDERELFELGLIAAMMAEVVIALVDAFDRNHAAAAGNVQGDESRRVGLQGQPDQVAHQLLTGDRVVRILDIQRRLSIDFGFGQLSPFLRFGHPPFQVANAGEVGIEAVPVTRAQIALQRPCIIADQVHDAAALADQFGLPLALLRRLVDKQLGEQSRRPIQRRDHSAVVGVTGVRAAARVEHQRREAGGIAQALRHQLVDRARVLGAAGSAHRRRGQDARFGAMPALDTRMGDAGNHGHLFAQILQSREVTAGLVIATRLGRKQILGDQTEPQGHGHETLRRVAAFTGGV